LLRRKRKLNPSSNIKSCCCRLCSSQEGSVSYTALTSSAKVIEMIKKDYKKDEKKSAMAINAAQAVFAAGGTPASALAAGQA
jgi:hypothetical protein